MIPIINGGASFLTYGLAFSNLMFRYYDVIEFAIGQNDLKDLLCEIWGSENGLSTYNILDFLTFLASLQMIMTGIVISQSQANNANNIAQKATYQNPADEGGQEHRV